MRGMPASIRIGLLLFLIIALSISCTSPQETQTPVDPSDPFSIPWEDRSVFRSGLAESYQAVLEQMEGASVYHIELRIAENLYQLSGRQEVRYTNTESVLLDEVRFRLFPNILGGRMQVSNIRVEEENGTPRFELSDSLLILPLASSLEPGASVVIGMDFAVDVPQSMSGNYGMFMYYDEVLALAHAYPMIPVYDDEGWNAEIPAPYGDVTYADAAFYLVKVTAPRGVTLVASGSEISRSEGEETLTVTVASGPARDFFLAASPNYVETTGSSGDVTLRSYAPPALESGSRAALEIAARSLELFNSMYSPYPYTELDIVATPAQIGGIEYPGAIVVTAGIYRTEGGDPLNRRSLDFIVAHEVAHQWFYNLVGGDQLDEPWLDESLAQYLTLQYFADQYGPAGEEGFRASLERRWESVGYADIPIGLPVAAYGGERYGPIVYGRGPLFLIALREEMGDAVFERFLRDYVERHSWGIATTELLHTLAEEHCACDLDPLFDEWVYP